MTHGVSVRAVDGGHIRGAQDVRNVIEIVSVMQLPNSKIAKMKAYGSFTTRPADMQATANSLHTSIASAWSARLGTLMSADSHFLRVEIRDMTSHLNPIFTSVGTAVDGAGTGGNMPAQDCIVLTAQIAARGKGLKGRSYWSGWTTAADAGSGQIAVAAQTAMNSFGADLFAAITARSLTPCVAQVARQAYTSLTGAEILARADNHVNVSSYTCRDLFWDTQRRRDIG